AWSGRCRFRQRGRSGAAAKPPGGAAGRPPPWTDYAPLGRRLPGTRFIAFKVPLRKSFNQNLHPQERFSPRDLLKKIREQKEELGLIIDLTYTTRYYGPEELPATLHYSKILTMGHEIPNSQIIYQFKCIVKNFLRDNKDNDKLIGVHCTHGLNRTGYLIPLCGVFLKLSPSLFLFPVFNRARGHPIERMNYIEDLQKRSVQKTPRAAPSAEPAAPFPGLERVPMTSPQSMLSKVAWEPSSLGPCAGAFCTGLWLGDRDVLPGTSPARKSEERWPGASTLPVGVSPAPAGAQGALRKLHFSPFPPPISCSQDPVDPASIQNGLSGRVCHHPGSHQQNCPP
uniref:RNA/RNP complex-1-interacting phosphatase n=1 Tax=Nothoprocta perdicaria TaxID=30464 RepID=A0A8C6ZHR5_NOTPE